MINWLRNFQHGVSNNWKATIELKNSAVKVFQILVLHISFMPEVRSCTKPILSIISKGRHQTYKPFMRLVAKTVSVKQKQGIL